jgi:hypothetical protein
MKLKTNKRDIITAVSLVIIGIIVAMLLSGLSDRAFRLFIAAMLILPTFGRYFISRINKRKI